MNSSPASALRYGMYVLMGVLGISVTLVAPMLDSILKAYQLPLSVGGMFTGAMSVGGMLAILLLGVFSDRMSKTKLVVAGYLVFALALILICFAPSYAFLLLFFAVVGIGSKAVDTLSNAVIKDAHEEGSGAYLNLMHMFLGMGAILGPLVSGGLLSSGVPWKAVFAGLGILCALLTLGFWIILTKQKAGAQRTQAKSEGNALTPIKAFIRDRRIWVLCLVVFFYVGHQSCINTWTSMYFQKQFASGDGLSGLALALYWLGIVISRLLCARYYTKENAKKLLLYGSALGFLALGCGVLLNSPIPMLIALVCCGILTGGTIPIVIDMACGLYSALSGAITSLIYVFMTAAPFIFPVLMGSMSEAYGMQVGISFAVGALALQSAASFFMTKESA